MRIPTVMCVCVSGLAYVHPKAVHANAPLVRIHYATLTANSSTVVWARLA